MATDARIAVGLPSHPKTKKLIKRLGQPAAWNLVCLILWAATNRSDGNLTGMSVEDIELAADWCGEDGAFVDALTNVRFLDNEDGDFVLHDWHEHNPWAAGADMRSAKARWNAAKRHHGATEADRLVPEFAAIRNATSNATSTHAAKAQHDDSNAPSPPPSPSPSPSEKKEGARKRSPSFAPEAIDLPEWLDRDLWASWCADRKKRGKAITEKAAELQIEKLAEFRAVGHSPESVIEHSIASSYQGLFAPKATAQAAPKTGPQAESFRERDERLARERWEQAAGRAPQHAHIIDITPAEPARLLEIEP